MKFALVGDDRLEATPGAKGVCPSCKSPMVAKCGETNVWHWSHSGRRICDSWWENETQWHRNWKGVFPPEWQERIHFANGGEKHIADVKTDRDWVLEFQHSFLKADERRARSLFYEKLVWIIDGNRRPRLKAQFFKVLNDERPVCSEPPIQRIFLLFSSLLLEWADTGKLVVFDFGADSPLWCLLPTNSKEMYVHVAAISRPDFIEFHQRGSTLGFSTFVEGLSNLVEAYHVRQKQLQSSAHFQTSGSFGGYAAQRARARSRFRF